MQEPGVYFPVKSSCISWKCRMCISIINSPHLQYLYIPYTTIIGVSCCTEITESSGSCILSYNMTKVYSLFLSGIDKIEFRGISREYCWPIPYIFVVFIVNYSAYPILISSIVICIAVVVHELANILSIALIGSCVSYIGIGS